MNAKVRIGMLVVALAGSSFLASCTSMITEEQLAELQRLRNSERQLKQQLEAARQKLGRLENEVDARQADVDNCNTRKQFVESKLAQWPNVWPDWSPASGE